MKFPERPVHPDFAALLVEKPPILVDLYHQTRELVLTEFPEANELFYHTHALTSVYSPTLKLKNAFLHIPIYTSHFNLGFNYGALLPDPHSLLEGTGKSIRHIPVNRFEDIDRPEVRELIQQAIQYAFDHLNEQDIVTGRSVSKIK